MSRSKAAGFALLPHVSLMNLSGMSSVPIEPRPGRYRHYKGNEYRVIGVARHTETSELVVVYQALYGEMGLWIRPHAMFCEEVIVDGQTKPRFSLVSAS